MEKGGIKALIIILVILIIAAGGTLAYKISKDKENNNSEPKVSKVEEKTKEKEVQVFKGNERPIAVMIDNHSDAWPQAGLNKAYMVYEIVVEGGETRLMALFKGQDLDKIGPVRSARHYFLDYALENDAVYVHFGESPQAKKDIKNLGVDAINGIYESSEAFWRTKDKRAPHNVATSIEQIKKIAESNKYTLKSTNKSVLSLFLVFLYYLH